jgi:two-component system sensor histidine kinase/response regulator
MHPAQAASAEEGLAMVREAAGRGTPFPLLLTDVHMPKNDGFTLIDWIAEQPLLPKPAFIVLTSVERRDDRSRCRAQGVAGFLTKPVRRDELRQTIAAALGYRRAKNQPGISTEPAHKTVAGAAHILLAEDNSINQRVATRILEKEGHEVHLAQNGLEAVAAAERSAAGPKEARYDMILMDIQMPEMDGLEATRAIRLRERAGGWHIPIIAMTAHARAEDRLECLNAGMDDYISKPIDARVLIELVAKHAAARKENPAFATMAECDG